VTRRASIAGVCASVLTLAVAVLYAAIILSEGDDPVEQWAPWAVGFVSVGLIGLTGSFVMSVRRRRQVFLLCAVATLGVGVLAIFSVGAFLVVAGLLFLLAAWNTSARAD
jgi:hypothetical protein